jgi:chemotaxis protein MotB
VSQKQPPVIIIRKVAHGRHGHHGGAWKVAYADFVTAMMAFFLVMWLVNTSPQVKSSIASYFREPGIFQTTSGGGAMPGASAGATPGTEPSPSINAARQALEDAAERIREALERLPSFDSIKDRIEIQITAEGLRIELLDAGDRSFFGVGSAEVRPETIGTLQVITAQLRALPNRIAIEGHTDSRPYAAGGYTNWELSSSRANAARRIMEEAGLARGRLEALHGFADSRLRYRSAPLDARNRRVAIVVRYETTP